MAGRISGIGMKPRGPQVPMPEADPAYWQQQEAELELQRRKQDMENAGKVYAEMQRELRTYGHTLDDPQGARLTANTQEGLGPIAMQRKAAGDIAPGPQKGSGDRRRMAAGVSKASKARQKVASALHSVIDPANKAIDYYAGPHLGPALGRAAEGANYVAGATPGLGDAMQLGQAGADYVDAMGAGDWMGAAGALGMGTLGAMFVPMAAKGPGMSQADELALAEAERMWNEVPTDKRTFGLARDIWSKTGLTYVPGTDGRFVKEVADPTWKPGVKEQVIDKGVPFVGRWDQAFDAPEMLPYTPDVPAMPTYLAHDSHTVQGAYSPKAGGGSDMLAMGPEFRPGSDWGNGSLLEAAGHETQHAIFDQATGPDGYSLPGGSSPKGLPQFVKKSRLYGPDPMEGYRASTGENFSHAIMRRYGWTPEKRAARMPYDDMPQPPEGLQWTRLLKKSENGPGYVGQFGWADPRVSGGIDIMDTTLYDTIPAKSQVRKMGETWKDAQTPTPPERQGPPAPPPRPWREQLGIGQGRATDQLTDEIFLPQRGAKGEPDFKMFELAQSMEKAGASPEEIWAATSQGGQPGIWRAPDGRWRWELDDSGAKLTSKGQHLAKSERNARGDLPMEPLPTLWDHPKLYAAEPRARTALARIVEDGGSAGEFSPLSGNLSAYGPRMVDPAFADAFRRAGMEPPKPLGNVVNHEVQHLVSNLNDMPTGSMPGDGDHQYIRDLIASRGQMQPSDHTIYTRASDEVLARLTDGRMQYPPESRAAMPPSLEMDVPANQQWVRETDGSIWVPDGNGGRQELVGPRQGWMTMADAPAGRSGDAAGLTDEMAATPVRGGVGGPPRAPKGFGKIGHNGGPPMRQDYDPLEVINARAQQMDLPKKQRVQPSGKDPLFDTSREAYERTKHVLPQGALPSPRVGSIEELKGALQRSHPLAVHADAIAGRIAEKIAPYKGTETQYFYNMAPVYEKLRQTGLTEEESLQWLHDFGAAYGGTSPRTDTENNIRNAFLLLNKRERGMPFDSVEGPGTTSMSGDGAGLSEKGFPMMDMHRELTRDLLNDVDRMNTNPKPTNFKGGAQGNLKTVTADTHAIRGVLVAFNELHPGQIPGGWFKSKADFANYQQDPVGWMKNPKNIAEKINDSLGSRTVNKVPSQVEYGVMDDIYRLVGSKADVEPAEAQSLGWFTSGSDTNLASAPHSIPSLIDQRVDVTAQLMGVPKEVVWQKLARFKTPVAGISGLMVADQMRRRMEQEQERTNAY